MYSNREDLHSQKIKTIEARTYVELVEGETDRIKMLIKSSEYRTIRAFAENVLMIHHVSLSRKLTKERRFHYYEILLIEKALGTKIEMINAPIENDKQDTLEPILEGHISGTNENIE